MRQTVYLDILILLNSLINFYILYITGSLSHSRIIRVRLLLGGLLGGILSVTVLLPEMNEVLSLLFKALSSALIVYVAFDPLGKSVFIRRYIYFMLVNFIFAGAVLFCCFVFETPLIYYNNSNFYFDIGAPFLIVIATLTYLLINIMIRRTNMPKHIGEYYELEIYKGNDKVRCKAFADTGNSLCDVFTGEPVLVVELTTADKLLPDAFKTYFISEEITVGIETLSQHKGAEEIRLVPFSSVGGTGFLKAFRFDEIKIRTEDKYDINTYVLKNGYIAVYNGNLSTGDYEAILNPEILDIARKVA